jgi:hypothetical protein
MTSVTCKLRTAYLSGVPVIIPLVKGVHSTHSACPLHEYLSCVASCIIVIYIYNSTYWKAKYIKGLM